jgi:hypothetical protein
MVKYIDGVHFFFGGSFLPDAATVSGFLRISIYFFLNILNRFFSSINCCCLAKSIVRPLSKVTTGSVNLGSLS